MALPLDPARSFHSRCNAKWAAMRPGSVIVLVLCFVLEVRSMHFGMAGTSAWLMLFMHIGVADLFFRASNPDSYVDWCEVPATLLRLFPLGTWRLLLRMLEDHGPRFGASIWPLHALHSSSWAAATLRHAVHVLRLSWASGHLLLSVPTICLRVRFSVSLATQLALLISAMPHTPAMCASSALTHPEAQRLTHQQYRIVQHVLELLVPSTLLPSLWAPGPASAAVPPQQQQPLSDPAAECAMVLTWLQVSIGFFVPLVWELVMKASQFQLHQRQRRQAGLPEERGTEAALFLAVWQVWPLGY